MRAGWALAMIAVGGCGRIGFEVESSAYASAVLLDQPIAYFRFDEPDGPIARSLVGEATGVYLGGFQYGTMGGVGDANTCVTFDGSSARIELGDVFPFEGTTPYSFEVWVRPTELDGFSRWIIDRSTSNAPLDGYRMYLGASFILFARRASDTEFGYVTASSKFGWSHVVVTYDGARHRWYVDAMLIENNAVTGSIGTGPGAFVVGDTTTGLTHKFWGELDELAIYATELGAERVAAHFAAAR